MLSLATGCAGKRADAWTPGPTTHWEDISTGPVGVPEDCYSIHVAQPTKGFFPADIAVTRVSVETVDEATQQTRPILFPTPRNEYLQFNAAFDDLMAVSEVFPVAQFDMGGAEAEPEQILAAFRALGARMGIIYAMNELSEDEAEIIGVLYYTSQDYPVASFHARDVTVERPKERRKINKSDLWETDARARVRRKFEGIVYACVRDMILHDEPPEIEDSSGWRAPIQLQKPEWPPRQSSGNP